ncbi:MAG: dTDP-glucose 4,6-dehydratase [Gammaproteobacteria bacterium]|nr:dTDP-glucose 4,6-dehydratase [Gammaproteobacteria bacterium]MBT8110809.1 dTDP-glucose 4,6-dehydratase [Gammaproteobacteria bacterium]NNL45508.1 dTDP-glucose 4,6-dehydratase [Woeseiaceae bacterium]
MRSVMVTGGAGFIGANFVHYWIDRYPDDRLIVLDALTYAGNQANLEPVQKQANFRFVHGNILDRALISTLMREEGIDTIVHFAAESHVDRSIHEPDAFIQTNVIGTHNLLMAARELWLDSDKAPAAHRFHHVSTDEVYGSLRADDAAFTEATPYAPNSPYAASKASSDHLVRSYHHTFGLEVTTSNCSNNYGPYQFPEKLIPLMIVNALTGQPLPIYGDGKNIRDWLYVTDHCRGIDLVISKGRLGATYNIGGNNEWQNIDIVKQVCASLDSIFAGNEELSTRFPDAPAAKGRKSESLITFVKDRLGHDWRYAIDATLATSELGYAPRQSFETGIELTLNWMLENENWWRAVMDGSYRDWISKNY